MGEEIRKVRVEDVYLKTDPEISIFIDVVAIEDGSSRVLEWPATEFKFPMDGSSVEWHMNHLKEALLKHKGRVVNLKCVGQI